MTLRTVSRFVVVLAVLLAIATTATFALANHKPLSARAVRHHIGVVHEPIEITTNPPTVDPTPTATVNVTVRTKEINPDAMAAPTTTDNTEAKDTEDKLVVRVYHLHPATSQEDAERGRKAWRLADNDNDYPAGGHIIAPNHAGIYTFKVRGAKLEKGVTYRFVVTNPAVPGSRVSTTVQVNVAN